MLQRELRRRGGRDLGGTARGKNVVRDLGSRLRVLGHGEWNRRRDADVDRDVGKLDDLAAAKRHASHHRGLERDGGAIRYRLHPNRVSDCGAG